MNKSILLLIYILLEIICLPSLSATDWSDSTGISFGIFGSINPEKTLHRHSADFTKSLKYDSFILGERSGEGREFNIGAVIDVPIWDSWFASFKLYYKSINSELIKSGVYTENANKDKLYDHIIKAKFNMLGIEPSIKYNIFDKLFINVGIQAAYIVDNSYSELERLTETTSGTFYDPNTKKFTESRIRNENFGTFETVNKFYGAANLGLSYKLPLSTDNKWRVEPELSYSLGFTNLLNATNVKYWNNYSVNLGISVKYSPDAVAPPLIDEFKSIEKIDTVTITVDNIDTNEFSMGIPRITKDTSEHGNIRLITETITRTDTLRIANKPVAVETPSENKIDIIEESLIDDTPLPIAEPTYNELYPLLPYIYFDINSSTVPNRYKQFNNAEVTQFEINGMNVNNLMIVYYNILNIIGARLTENSTLTLKIVACISDIGEEKTNREVAVERVQKVQDYFVDIWLINTNRLKIEYKNLTANNSDSNNIQENQRVELCFDKDKSLKPIFVENEISKFDHDELDDKAIDDSRAKSGVANKAKKKTSQDKKKRNEKSIVKDIEIINKILYNSDGFKTDRYRLVSLSENDNIIESNRYIIDFIKSRVKNNSEVEIIVYTKESGDEAYNTLANKAANEIKNKLQTGFIKNETTEKLLYNQSLPEGRLYSQTIEIIVKTKTK